MTPMWQSDAQQQPSMKIIIHKIWNEQYGKDYNDRSGDKYPTTPLWPIGRILYMFS